MEDKVVIQNGELFGKNRADLRTSSLKIFIQDWEKLRDELYDEIASKKGQVELLEKWIIRAHEIILDTNKEEQRREQEVIDARLEELTKQYEEEEERKRQEAAQRIHEEKVAAREKGKKTAKKHPSNRAKELQKRKAEAKASKEA